jgi:diguanylate cyclase
MLQFQILLAPVIALMGLAFLFSAVLRRFHGSKLEPYAFGVLFGVTAVIGMINPLIIGEGLIFDTRTLLTGAAVAYAGPIAGLVTVSFALVCRIIIGGAGVYAGIAGLGMAIVLALGWTHLMRDRIRNKVVGDALLGLAITPAILGLFVLPYELAMTLMVSILPTLLICNILGAMALGFVFRREMRYFKNSQKLAEYAQTDPLTQLLNRRGLDIEVEAVSFDRDLGHALFYFDIDNFKAINDTFGHDAGDAALTIIASRLKQSIRDDASFARHGGDEFSIYMPSLHIDDVEVIAKRLCTLIADRPITHKEHTFDMSISVGGYWTKEDRRLQDMIDRADAQLLLAKADGKNAAQVAFSDNGNYAAVA